ncbi:hypothetical protein GpartN1_g7044.t1 [Galdieria partita]|uniref:DUF155 domain-containing protein n=1 Tax=Galdieria partita TaxID=83374 RepID=A0A9C7Q2F2_9RHOD|nr:hypothetical protein GpartN1_g7044.t1 [Galdieria partita]
MSWREEQSPLLSINLSPPKNKIATLAQGRRTGAPQISDTIASRRAAYGGKKRLERLRAPVETGLEMPWTGRLSVYCTCNTYSLRDLFGNLLNKYPEGARRFGTRDVVHLRLPRMDGQDGEDDAVWWVGIEDPRGSDVFFFSYGVVVLWGLSEGAEWQLLDWLKNFENGRLEGEAEKEFLVYSYDHFSEEDLAKILEDQVCLSSSLSDETLVRVKLALSHGAAQSTKLGAFETAIDNVIDRTQALPAQMANQGKLNISQRELLKLSGELYMYKAYIHLQSDVLDIPDWFWDNEDVEPLYGKMARYLDIKPRVNVLNTRLETINSMYDLFRTELHVRTDQRLEWIIIWLIVIEVFLQVFGMFIGVTTI